MRFRVGKPLLAVVVVCGFVFGGGAAMGAATTLRVPQDFATIQAAIDAAAAGDTIQVAPGTHVGPVDVTTPVVIEGTGGAGATTLTAAGSDATAVMLRASAEGTVIRGLTIRDGGSRRLRYGGGVRVLGGAHTIEDSAITANLGCYGIGIYVDRGQLTLVDTSIAGNGTDDRGCDLAGVGTRGGGVYVVKGSVSITGGEISDNWASKGGALWVQDGTVALDGVSIADGHTISKYQAAVEIQGGVVTISRSEIVRDAGRGVNLSGSAEVSIENSVIAGNHDAGIVQDQLDTGGRLDLYHATVLGGSEAPAEGDLGDYREAAALFSNGTVRAVNSVLSAHGYPLVCWNGGRRIRLIDTVVHSIAHQATFGDCDIDLSKAVIADPGVAGWPFDPRPRPGGASVDLLATSDLATDVLGNPRPVDGDGDGSARFDAGAYELEPTGVSGRLRSQNTGRPLPGICVTAWAGGGATRRVAGATRTGPSGGFWLTLDPGTYRFELNDCGQDLYREAWVGGTGFTTAAAIRVTDGAASASGTTFMSVRDLCFGRPATIVGTPDADTINGTAGPDVVMALGGDDKVMGKGGDDRICLGDGDDRALGDGGNDRIDGGAGADLVLGGDGNDVLRGGDGDDDVQGEAGNDGIAAGPGNDVLAGGEGRNRLLGEDGDDLMTGGGERDVYAGGAGIDTVDLSGSTRAVVADLLAGTIAGQGRDRVGKVERVIGTGRSDTLRGDRGPNQIEGGRGNDTIEGRGGDDVLNGGSGADSIFGGLGDDQVIGGDGRDYCDGGGGSDSVYGNDEADTLHGGTGEDRVVGGRGSDVIYGHDGADALFGGDGDDEIYGGAGVDVLDGEYGADYLDGGVGADRLLGRDGPDILVGGYGDDLLNPGSDDRHYDRETDVVWGGPGNDLVTRAAHEEGRVWVSYALAAGPVTVDLAAGRATGEGIDILRDINYLVGSRFDDVLKGTSGNDEIGGGPGDDRIEGRAGRDSLYGSTGDDHLLGGADNDEMWGEAGDDRIEGSDGFDYLDGMEGRDTLAGGAGHDRCVDGEVLSSCEETYYRALRRLLGPPVAAAPWRRAPTVSTPV